MLIPIVGFMLYFMFYSRKLSKKKVGRIDRFILQRTERNDRRELLRIRAESPLAYSQAVMIRTAYTR